MDLHASSVLRAVLRLATPLVLTALVFLAPLAAPGSAKINTTREIIREIINPCFLHEARIEKQTHPELWVGKSENYISRLLKKNFPQDMKTIALKMEQSIGGPEKMQSMTRSERYEYYRIGREACIADPED